MINFNQYGAKPGVARQAGLLQQQMESNPVQPYVPFSQQSGLTPQVAPQVAPKALVLSPADTLKQLISGVMWPNRGSSSTTQSNQSGGGK